jgi:hypothetical protein
MAFAVDWNITALSGTFGDPANNALLVFRFKVVSRRTAADV